jgi:hypothetical protein
VFSSQTEFAKPDQLTSPTVAIKPEVRVVKQLDHGIGATFVSSVLEGAFALIDFWATWMEKSRMRQASTHDSRYKGMGNTIVQLRGPFCSG